MSLTCPEKEKKGRYFVYNFNKFKHICVIFGKQHHGCVPIINNVHLISAATSPFKIKYPLYYTSPTATWKLRKCKKTTVVFKFARFKSDGLQHVWNIAWESVLKALLDDLKHRLKAKCMRQAGSRSHCDNHVSAACVLTACMKALQRWLLCCVNSDYYQCFWRHIQLCANFIKIVCRLEICLLACLLTYIVTSGARCAVCVGGCLSLVWI